MDAPFLGKRLRLEAPSVQLVDFLVQLKWLDLFNRVGKE